MRGPPSLPALIRKALPQRYLVTERSQEHLEQFRASFSTMSEWRADKAPVSCRHEEHAGRSQVPSPSAAGDGRSS